MKDDLLEIARARRDELQRELDEINKFIKTAERLAQGLPLKAELPSMDNVLNTIGKMSSALASMSTTNVVANGLTRRGSTQEILDKVAEILDSENRPMRPAELIAHLRTRHRMTVGGENPASNLSAMLSLSKKRFKTLGHGKGWVLLKQEKIHG